MTERSASTDPAVRLVLDKVPKVHFFDGGPRPPEDDMFPACLRAWLEYRDEDLGFRSQTGKADPWHDVHTYLMGMTGAGFRTLWHPTIWEGAVTCINFMAPDALEPFRRGFEAAGYGCEFLWRKSFAADHFVPQEQDYDEATYRKRILESIRKGRPVIAIGVIGPPEACLIAGYDEGGDVLIGWNFFQGEPGVETEPNGMFRKRDWYKDTQGLILIGEKRPRPSERELLVKALGYGLEMMRVPEAQGYRTGQAAYTQWADMLLRDAEFNKDKPEDLHNRLEVHNWNGGALAEARAWASWWLTKMAEREPVMAEELLAAARCFDDEHDLVWAIWEFAKADSGKPADEDAKFADPCLRRRIVPLIRLARTRDAQAAEHIEKALEKLRQGKWPTAFDRNPRALVRRDNGRVWIDGVPPVGWGRTGACTFPGAMEAATAVTGHPWKYSDLMGVSALAFRLRWSNPETKGWSMASPCGEFMEEWFDLIDATGWAMAADLGSPKSSSPKDPAVKRVVASIDAGYPVMAPAGGPDLAVVYGYEAGGRRLLTYSYDHFGETTVVPAKEMGGFQLFLGGRQEPLPARDALLHALRNARRNWSREKSAAGYRDFLWYYGEKAFSTWIDDLARRDASKVSPEELRQLASLNKWVWLSLIDARNTAVVYLREHASLLDGDAHEALLCAADYYQQEVEPLEAAEKRGDVWDPHAGGDIAAWTPAQRVCQAEMLKEAMRLDGLAVAQIDRALRAVESENPPVPGAPTAGWYKRAVLKDVPRVGYDVYTCPTPGSLCGALEYIGDKVDYDYLMGVTGACFRRLFQRDDGGNIDFMYFTPEPYKRAAWALNYELTPVMRDDKGKMIRAIKESISRGRPVLAFGIIGPPEAGLVTGYDRGGEVLHGYSYFADGKQGYYDKTDWYETMDTGCPVGVLVIGDKRHWPGPGRREILVSSLKWAIEHARTPRRAGHACGLAAYDAWANALEVDADYPKDNAQILETRTMVHADQCCMLDERHCAARFLRGMVEAAPEASEPLEAAARLYDETAELGAKVWLWGYDMGPVAQQGIAVRKTRREMALVVRAAREKEAQAIELLEKALTILEPNPPSSRFTLDGPGKVGEDDRKRAPESIGMVSATRMALDFLGDDLGLPKAARDGQPDPRTVLLMAASGEAFRQCDTLYQNGKAADPERAIDGLMRATGYEYQLVLPEGLGKKLAFVGKVYTSEVDLAPLVADHLRQKRGPILLLEGGQWPDWRLITGFDREGKTLIGYGGDLGECAFTPGGPKCPQKSWWIGDFAGDRKGAWLILLGDKRQAPPATALYGEALRYGLSILSTKIAGKAHAGAAAYGAWAASLAEDKRFPAGNAAMLRQRWNDHRVRSAELAERRWYAAQFLDQAALQLPSVSAKLKTAGADFQRIHDLVWQMWELTGGYMHPDSQLELADPAIRRKIVPLILQCAEADAAAMDHLTRPVAKIDAG